MPPVQEQPKQSTNSLKKSQESFDTLDLDVWYTPIGSIAPGVQRLTEAFFTKKKTHSLQFRLNQLRNVYFEIKDNVDQLSDALYKDFHRSRFETRNLEILGGLNEIVHIMENLQNWSKPEKVTDLPLNLKTQPVYIERIPLGVVLIISPFNYPFFLSISAVVGAIAAGNAVVLKQSEMTPNFSKLFSEILTKALDPDIFLAVNGAIPETTEVLNQKFDKIMYTGNNMVGTIVAKKAAETLTPTILELGGKSPAFILDDVQDKDLDTVARRVAWGRFTNAGQTCVAVDYVLVPKKLHGKFVASLNKVMSEELYPNIDSKDDEYTHIIHDRAFKNLSSMLESTQGDIIIGGVTEASSRFIAPTVVDNVSWDDIVMKNEIFGPILPIIEYETLSDAIIQAQRRHDTPLAQYIFTSGSTSRKYNRQVDQILTTIRSGGTIINDVILHVGLLNAPFGGVGNSGMGAYHGKFSFRHFTHERTTIESKLWNDFIVKVRYPPYTKNKDTLVRAAQSSYGGKVWFGRVGDVKVSGPNAFFTVWNEFTATMGLMKEFVSKGL
ncbi:Aldehyde dehydrogenase dimeric NADP-preferring [Spathaspora sp. JA1]|nr:Aldehyde dehydrogenase dimeric NADP-preferring [Spathaspora sp. JA1]